MGQEMTRLRNDKSSHSLIKFPSFSPFFHNFHILWSQIGVIVQIGLIHSVGSDIEPSTYFFI